ncbi:mucin-17-like isoform X2 [Ornithodoros turicata]|uniref:mucin-17-like isoform X2 n=1 Tax=Ornithodoros turicata TaxID=34597 RepID=UPI003138F192
MAAESAAPLEERCEVLTMDEGPHLNEELRQGPSGGRVDPGHYGGGGKRTAPRMVLCEFLRCLEECGAGHRYDPWRQASTLTSCWISLTSWWKQLPFLEAAKALTLKTLQLINSSFGKLPRGLRDELCAAIGCCSETLGPHMVSFSAVCRCLLEAATMPQGDTLLQRLLQEGTSNVVADAHTSGEACGLTEAVGEAELLLRLECLRFWEREATVERVCRARLRSCCARCCERAASSKPKLSKEEPLEAVPSTSSHHDMCQPRAGPSSSKESGIFLVPKVPDSPKSGVSKAGPQQGQCFQELLLCSLYRQRKIQEFCKETSGMSCHQGVQLIRSLRGSGEDLERQDVSEALAHVFLVRDLLLPSTYCCTRDLMVLWCELQGQSLDHVGRAAQRLVVPHASASAHFYLFADVLWEHFGRGLFPVYLDMFVRGLTTDINHLEVAVHKEESESVYELEVHIAGVFAKMSSLFFDHPEVARQCMLSAFALEPTEERLNALERLTRQIHATPDTAGGVLCRCGGLSCKNMLPEGPLAVDDGRPTYEADFWHPVLSNILPGVSYALLKDLVTVLECLRPRTLTLCSDWQAYLNSYLNARHGANYPVYCGSADSEMDSTSEDDAGEGPSSLDRILAGSEGMPPQGGKRRDKRRANAKCKSSHKKKKGSRHHHKEAEEGKDPPRVKKKSKKKSSSHRRAEVEEPSPSIGAPCLPPLRVLLSKFDSLSAGLNRRAAENKAGSGPTVVSRLTLPNISADLKEPWLVDKDRLQIELPKDDTFQRVADDFHVGLGNTPLKRFLKCQIRRPILSKKKVPVKVVVRAAKPSLRFQSALSTVISTPKVPSSAKAASAGKTPAITKSPSVCKVPAATRTQASVIRAPVTGKPAAVSKPVGVAKAAVVTKAMPVNRAVAPVSVSPASSAVTKPLRDYIKITKSSATASVVQTSSSQVPAPISSTPAISATSAVQAATCQAPHIVMAPTMRIPMVTTTTYSRLVTSTVQNTPVSPMVASAAMVQQQCMPRAPLQVSGACITHLPVVSTTAATIPSPVAVSSSAVPTVASQQPTAVPITMDSTGQAFTSLRSGQATVLRLPVYSRVIQQHMGQAAIKTDNPPGVCMLPMKLVNAAVLSGQEKTLSVGNQKITINPLPSLLANTSAATGVTVAASGGTQNIMTAKILPTMMSGQNIQAMQQMMRLNTLQGGLTPVSGTPCSTAVLPTEQLTGQPGLATNLTTLTMPLPGSIATAGGRVIAGKIMIPVNSLLQQGATLQAGQGMSLSGMPVIILKNQAPPKIVTDGAAVPQQATPTVQAAIPVQANGAQVTAVPASAPPVPLSSTTVASPAPAVAISSPSTATTAANLAAKKTWMPIRSKPGSMEYRKACNMPLVKATRARVLAPVTQPTVTYTTPSSIAVTKVTVAPGVQLPCRTITLPGGGVAHLTVPMASLATTVQQGLTVTTSATGVQVATSTMPAVTQVIAPKIITRQVTVPLAKLLQKPPLIVAKPADLPAVTTQALSSSFGAPPQVVAGSHRDAEVAQSEVEKPAPEVPSLPVEVVKAKEVVVKPRTAIHLPFPDDLVDPTPSGATFIPITSSELLPTKMSEDDELSRQHRRRKPLPVVKTRTVPRPALSSSTLRSLTSICDAVKYSILAADETAEGVDAEATVKNCMENELDYSSDDGSERSIEDLFEEEAMQLRLDHEDELNGILYVPESNTSEPDYEATPWSSQSYCEPPGSECDPRDITSAISENSLDSLTKRAIKPKTPAGMVSTNSSMENNSQSPSKFYCGQCDRGFFSAYNLRRHQKNVHKMEFRSFPQQRSPASSPVPCMRETPSPQQRIVPTVKLAHRPVSQTPMHANKGVVHPYQGHRQNVAAMPKQVLLDSDADSLSERTAFSGIQGSRESDSEETPLLTIKDEPTEPIRRSNLLHQPSKTKSTPCLMQVPDGAPQPSQHAGHSGQFCGLTPKVEMDVSPDLSKSLDPDDILESLEVAKMSGWSASESPNTDGSSFPVKQESKRCTALEELLAKDTGNDQLGNHIGRQSDSLDAIEPTVPPDEAILGDVHLDDDAEDAEDVKDVHGTAWDGLSADDMKAVESLAGEYVTDSLEFFVAPKNAMGVEDNDDPLGFPERIPQDLEDGDDDDALDEAMNDVNNAALDVKTLGDVVKVEEDAKPCTSHCRTRSREASVKRSCPCCEDASPKRCRPSPRLTRSASTSKARSTKKVRIR